MPEETNNIYDKKFTISQYFKILGPEELKVYDTDLKALAELQANQKGGAYFLCNEKRKQIFLINPMMKSFFEAFRNPITPYDLVDQFAAQAKCDPAQIEDTVLDFFDMMEYRRILVLEEEAKKIALAKRTKRIHFFKAGQVVDQYKIVEALKIKTKVEIYLAEDLKTKEIVVIKLPLTQRIAGVRMDRTQKIKKLFQQEMELMHLLQGHPNVCKLHKFVETKDYCFAALEYIQGVELKHLVRKENIPLSKRLQLISQIFSVFAHLQKKEILHGDVHANNFLIQGDNTVKLIDFGMSNRAKPQDDEIISKGGQHRFIPPEKIKVNGFSRVNSMADFRSEVFQLGLLAYLLLYGELPFNGLTWKHLAKAIKTKEPEFKEEASNGELIPTFVKSILTKALQKKPQRRFRSAITLSKHWDVGMRRNGKMSKQATSK